MKPLSALLMMIIVSTLGITPVNPQPLPKLSRIGILVPWSGAPEDDHKRHRDAFLQGLKELGYADEKNIRLEWRYADGKADNLRHLAEELIRLNPALIVANGTTAIAIAMKATKTIPIVMISGGNPVVSGFVKSLSIPGGNVTGFSSSSAGLSGKRIELLKETLPGITRVAVLNADKDKRRALSYEKEGKALELSIDPVHVTGREELNAALFKIAATRPDALVIVRNIFTVRHAEEILQFALKNRTAAMYEARLFVTSGGLMSYGIDYTASWRRAAVYVDKILKGANPATLPVEPPQLELVVNLKTAQKIGVTIPPEILLEANEVIK